MAGDRVDPDHLERLVALAVGEASIDEGSASMWGAAFAAVAERRDFIPLSELLDGGRPEPPPINARFDFGGRSLTPVFAAVELGLEDLLPRFLGLGADVRALCIYEGLLCTALHVAALRLDVPIASLLLEFLGPAGAAGLVAESRLGDLMAEAEVGDGVLLSAANAVHVLVARDIWSEEMYRLLLRRGVPLSALCKFKDGAELPGMLLPQHFSTKEATADRLDLVLGEEVKSTIKNTRLAGDLNTFLEACSVIKMKHGVKSYRCAQDIDFLLSGRLDPPAALGRDADPSTALLYAADVGNSEALRLLLYAGADPARSVQRVLRFDAGRAASLPLTPVFIALLRRELAVVDSLLFFGVSAAVACDAVVHSAPPVGAAASFDAGPAQESWEGLTMLHVAVLDRNHEILAELAKRECYINAVATRDLHRGGPAEEVTPLRLAVLLSEVRCTAALLDCGAGVTEVIRAEACANPAVCEMFGGPSVVGLEEWVAALLSGEHALQQLIDRRTDLTRVLNWPRGSAVPLLEPHRLASPALVAHLVKALEEVPTSLSDVRPVHLACLLQQPWALGMLADQGVAVVDSPPCAELPLFETGLGTAGGGGGSALVPAAVPMDAVLLSVRLGGLQVLEFLCKDPRFAANVNREIPLAPDVSPPFFAKRETQICPPWAWCRLGPLELALLHRRVDMVVLLVRLGAELLHTVDHVAIEPPTHYAVTDMCFRGLTPLHLCALLDLSAGAAALLNEACMDGEAVVENEFTRAQRQAMLSAVCVQGWATVETSGCPEKEQWLWRDLTPLHLAILRKNYAVAELLIDVSTADTLGRLCISKDVEADLERSFSALLLAFEQNNKELHRKIAKRFPTC